MEEPLIVEGLSVYQICHDPVTYKMVNKDCIAIHNARLTKYFENSVILGVMSGRSMQEYLKTKPMDKVGFLSARYEVKNNASIDLKDIADQDKDLYVMPGCLHNHDVMNISNYCHGVLFSTLFISLVRGAGVKVKDFDMKVGIYQNGVVAKLWVWKDYLNNYLIPVFKFMEKENLYKDFPAIHTLLHSDSLYRGNLSQSDLKEMSGYSYYTMHTFILERLWSLYYHNNQDKLTTNF